VSDQLNGRVKELNVLINSVGFIISLFRMGAAMCTQATPALTLCVACEKNRNI
jgi:hypothetical protein